MASSKNDQRLHFGSVKPPAAPNGNQRATRDYSSIKSQNVSRFTGGTSQPRNMMNLVVDGKSSDRLYAKDPLKDKLEAKM